ncbi:MAG: NAD-dependent epimerase/dehydratase family protein [Candidatus Gastranaerophilaceae bacterium]|jgi:UDP-glucose 4-epimerase
MAVLITGGCGFIGSHITDLFIENDYEVIIVDDFSSGTKNFLNEKAKIYQLDIQSKNVEDIFKENTIDYVIHLAAQASVSVSNKNPIFDACTNIVGSLNLIELSKKYNVKKFIVASTAAVYGMPEYLPVDEKHPVNPMSNYGLSKLTMEKYLILSNLDYIIFRYSNVYGPRQNPHGEAGVISIFLDKMKRQEFIEIHGDGEQTRDFIFVQDIARANLLAIQSNIKNEIFNISTCTKISINELFYKMKSILNSNSQVIHTNERSGDIKHSTLDNSKAKTILDWQPMIKLEEGLEQLFNQK